MLKKKYANYPNIKGIIEKVFLKKEIPNNEKYACACLMNIKKVEDIKKRRRNDCN